MTPDTLLYVTMLFLGLFGLGTVASLYLYKWDYTRYFRSELWTKTYYWIPILIIFIAVLYLQFWAAIAVLVFIVGFIVYEVHRTPSGRWFVWVYALAIALTIGHLPLFFTWPVQQVATSVLLVVAFSSVLSDVFAYFFGNLFGKHKLPAWINSRKSWQGIIGQIVGAVVGYMLIIPTVGSPPPILFAVMVGAVSAVGDIANSIVKRRVGIKDWGNTIPGHGGMLDRFASLALAIAAGYWWVFLGELM